ncbi:MAG: PAS domain S-box protein [Candidatus Kapaibacteriota bacterium]
MNEIELLKQKIDELTKENESLKEELKDAKTLKEQVTNQTIEIEQQLNELTSIRYKLELQNHELKRTNYENQLLLNKFNALFNFAPVGFLLVDEDFIIIEANKTAEAIFEKNYLDLIGINIFFITPQNFKEQFENIIKLPKDEINNSFIRFEINFNGKIKYLRADLRILENIFESRKFILFSLVDLTEIIYYQKLVEESENKFRSIFEQSPVGIYRTTPDGRVLLGNKKLIEMLGYNSFEDLAKLNLEADDYPMKESRNAFKEKIEKTGEVIGDVYTWYRKDGSSIIVRDSAKVIKDENGNVLYYQGVIEDITEKEYLKETLEVIINSIPDLFIISDENGKYLEIYTAAQDNLYREKDELLGKRLDEVFPEEMANYFLTAIQSTLKDNRPVIINYDLDTLSGKKSFEAILTPTKLKSLSEKPLVIFNVRDITERKKIEMELVQSSYEKDLLFSVISYDLRDPITSLITTADIFTNYYEKLTPEQLKNYIFQLSQEIYTLKNLIDNLMDWSKSQSGKLEFVPELTDLYNLVEGAILVYFNLAKSKKLNIISSIQPRTYCFVDRFMISSVLRNLIANAIKYSYPDTTISISIEELNNYYKISITDSGVGIEESKIATIFDDNESYSLGIDKKRTQGLGLHICKKFVERNKGEISIQSEFGKWTSISFTIPKPDSIP